MGSITKPMLGRAPRRGQTVGSDFEANLADNYRKIVGAYIRRHRLEAGMTQEDLARQLGMWHSAVSGLELGRTTVSPEKLYEIARIFGLDTVEWGKFLLRYTNPWVYGLIYGVNDPSLAADLAKLPNRMGNKELQD